MADAPLIEIRDVVKRYGGLRPLRLKQFVVQAADAMVVSGLDAGAAETFVHLVSGATLPDEGSVRVGGFDTREIATDTEWLASLDRFGIVTHRAVFIEGLSVAANMALPLTLSIDPMSAETRAEVTRLAAVVQLPRDRLDATMGTLTPAERVRVHLARALAPKPRMILLEHPTATLSSKDERIAFGAVVRAAVSGRDVGFVGLSEDADFGIACGATRWTLNGATGEIGRAGGWWPWR